MAKIEYYLGNCMGTLSV